VPDQIILTLFLVILLAFAFDFINGFHDTANAVATAIATGALLPRTAVLLAAVMNFLGALAFNGVAQNIAGNLIRPFDAQSGLQIIAAALAAAMIWNLATWLGGLPSSSSHALLGALTGAAYAAAGSRVLDAGCGASIFPVFLAKLGHRVSALDLRVPEGLGRLHGVEIDYVRGELTALPFADAQFDAVFCISVIEHLGHQGVPRALQELRRVVRPGGRLLITTDFYEDARAPATPRTWRQWACDCSTGTASTT